MRGSNTIRRLETFHRSCARFLTGDFIHPQEEGEWVYPHTEDVFDKLGLQAIETYIEKRRQNVANYLTPGGTAMTDIANSPHVEINMEKVCWWKPPNPDIIPPLTLDVQ